MEHQAPKRILIIEDSLEIQSLLTFLLESDGYVVDKASSGNMALELLRSNKSQPGLIMLDLMMPDMDGHQFRSEQMQDQALAAIPVVVMTADGEIQAKSTKLGAQGFLKKPFVSIDSILETVQQFF